MNPVDHEVGLGLAYESLHGNSVGDALGAQFFGPGRKVAALMAGRVPPPPWEWTDDTETACSVVAELRDHGRIDADRLAAAFAHRCEPHRGYGPGSVVVLHEIRDGRAWRDAAAAVFGGAGSCGNGAAMRAAPLGAYHCGDLSAAVAAAGLSAEVTRCHPEGIAGAVAAAGCLAATARMEDSRPTATEFLAGVVDVLGESVVRDGIVRAMTLAGATVGEAAYELGNGSQSTAQDSVPFAVWVAATHLRDYPTAVTVCVQAGGDVDTTAAMAGGIVAAHTCVRNDADSAGGMRGVLRDWLAAREYLPDWAVRGR